MVDNEGKGLQMENLLLQRYEGLRIRRRNLVGN
jgi:hypothetical protein